MMSFTMQFAGSRLIIFILMSFQIEGGRTSVLGSAKSPGELPNEIGNTSILIKFDFH